MSASAGLSNAGKIFFGSLCVGTFGLGCWQTQRFFEKQHLVAEREADLAQEPTTDIGSIDRSSFRRVRLMGVYQYDGEFLVGPRGPPPGALPDKPGSSAAGMSSAPQGYFVVTPLCLEAEKDNEVVLINRGWVPRHMVVRDARRGRQAPKRQDESSSASLASAARLYQWERPKGTVQVIAVPAKPEQPRFLVSQHDVSQRPAILFWYDLPAMQAVAGLGIDRPAVLWTAVQDESNDNDKHITREKPLSWPVKPTAEKVGDFKVSPAIHASYAFTWFGLSTAGMYMTRKLITKGRG